MAFALANLALVGPAKGIKDISAGALGNGAPKVFSYITEDAHATVDSAGYFNAAVAYGGAYYLMDLGDIVMVVVAASGAPTTYGTHIVVNKASGTLDVSNVTVGTMTDSD